MIFDNKTLLHSLSLGENRACFRIICKLKTFLAPVVPPSLKKEEQKRIGPTQENWTDARELDRRKRIGPTQTLDRHKHWTDT